MKYYKQDSLSVKLECLLAELVFSREVVAACSPLGRNTFYRKLWQLASFMRSVFSPSVIRR